MKFFVFLFSIMGSFSSFSGTSTDQNLIISCDGHLKTGETIEVKIFQRFQNGGAVVGFANRPVFQTQIKKNDNLVYESKTTLFSKENNSFYSSAYFHLDQQGSFWSLYLENRTPFGIVKHPYLNSLKVNCTVF